MNKIMIVLFILLCSASLFLCTDRLTDSQIIPKCVFSLMIVGIIGIVYAVSFFIGKEIHWKFGTISSIIIILCIVESGIGILQFCGICTSYSYIYRVTGSFDNPAGFAGCLCAGIPFTLSLYTNPLIKVRKVGYLSSLFIAIAIILSGSRSGLVCLVFIALFYWGNKYKKYMYQRGNRLFVFVILLVVVLSFFIGIYCMKKDSANGRLLIWRCTWEMIKEKPIIGYGMNAFQKYYMDYQATYFSLFPDSKFVLLADNVNSPFNEYLSVWVQFGMIGLISIIVLFIFLVYCYMQSPLPESYICLLSLLSISIFSLFSYPFSYPFVWIIAVMCSIILVKHAYHFSFFNKQIMRLCLVVSFFGISFWMLYSTGVRIKAELDWKKATELILLGKKNEALQLYKELLYPLKREPYFLYNYAAELYLNDEYEKSLKVMKICRKYWANYDLELLIGDVYMKLKCYDKAEIHYQKAAWMCPCRFVPLDRMLELYQEVGDRRRSYNIARIILKKQIKVDSVTIRIVKENATKVLEIESLWYNSNSNEF